MKYQKDRVALIENTNQSVSKELAELKEDMKILAKEHSTYQKENQELKE